MSATTIRRSHPDLSPSRMQHAALGCLLAFVTVLGVAPVAAQDGDDRPTEAADEALIDRYVDALEHYDVRSMSALWAEEVVYEDPTFGARFEGREATRDALLEMMGPQQEVSVRIVRRFTSNRVTVLSIKGSMRLPRPGGAADDWVAVEGEGVMVVVVADGRIVRHTDYIDYASVRRQLAAASSGGDGPG